MEMAMESLNSTDITILETPIKSESDTKEYRMIKLNNDLIALLISDINGKESTSSTLLGSNGANTKSTDTIATAGDKNDTDNAEKKNKTNTDKLVACILSIDVGYYSDPLECDGLAHFLEHMVFLGSKKYPQENDYSQYIIKHGGNRNAETGPENTIYYFSIPGKHFNGALDRLSQFLKEPLMHKHAMQREREAINSEFYLSIQSDSRRLYSIYGSLANPQYPHNKLGVGNLITLKENITDDDLYLKVHEFRRKHYSSHRMSLAIQAGIPLDELQNKVNEYFGDIPNNKISGDYYSHLKDIDPFIPDFYNKYIYGKCVTDFSNIIISWFLPSSIKEYKTKPFYYLTHLINYKGSGSLNSYLNKRMSWSMSVTCEYSKLKINSTFSIIIMLTKSGENHIKEILDAVFAYLKYIKMIGSCERIYKELQNIADISFRYANEAKALYNVRRCVSGLKIYPPRDCLTGPSLLFEYDSEAIINAINEVNKFKFNLLIASKNLLKDSEYELTEKWYGAKYSMRDYPTEWLNSWKNIEPYAEFYLPIENKFITTDFTIYGKTKTNQEQQQNKYPEKIFENKLCELWFRQDDIFLLPSVNFNFKFISELPTLSAKNSVIMSIYISYLRDELFEELYPATVAKLNYSFYLTDNGFVFKATGYNQKIHIIIETFVKYMKEFVQNICENKFQKFVDVYKQEFYNNLIDPSSLATTIEYKITKSRYWTTIENNAAVENITFNEFRQFCIDLLREFKIVSLIQGNYEREAAKNIMLKLLESLNFNEIKNLNSFEIVRFYKIPKGCEFFKYNTFNTNDVNSIISNYYQLGIANINKTCLLELLLKISSEPLFNILRTKEQLSYNVSNSIGDEGNVLKYEITVKSQETKFESQYIEERMENFRSTILKKIIDDLSDHDFEQYKESLIKINQIVDSNLYTEVQRNWSEITLKQYCFNRRERNIECYKSITKSEFLDFCTNFFDIDNQRKFSIQIVGSKESKASVNDDNFNNDDDVNIKSTNEFSNKTILSDIKLFQEKLNLYPLKENIIKADDLIINE